MKALMNTLIIWIMELSKLLYVCKNNFVIRKVKFKIICTKRVVISKGYREMFWNFTMSMRNFTSSMYVLRKVLIMKTIIVACIIMHNMIVDDKLIGRICRRIKTAQHTQCIYRVR